MLTLHILIALLNEAKCVALVELSLFGPNFSGIEFKDCDFALHPDRAVSAL